IDPLIESLLGQTLADCELVFVDDGSTDETPARLDALAAAHAQVRVRHIENSGWPGRPRNVGLELATGEFVFFADNDDWLGPEALERLCGRAVRDDADVVVGKVVGHGKVVPRRIFTANRHDLAAADAPFGLLTPHKLFRRALLDEHGLRFPEGRRPLEDHALVVPAFFHARRIAIVADYPCYHWVLRRDRENASAQNSDMQAFHASVAEVLDLVDAHTEPGELRDRLYLRWYRGKLLGRVGNARFVRAGAPRRQERFEAARALVEARFAPHLDARLPYALRLRAALLRRGSLDGLETLGRYDRSLRPTARLQRVAGDGTWMTLRVNGVLRRPGDREPPLVVRDGKRLRFDAPELEGVLAGEDLDATGALADDRALLFLRSADGVEWELPTDVRVKLVERPEGRLQPQLRMVARVAPTVAAG